VKGAVGHFPRLQDAIERMWARSAFHREHWLRRGVQENWIPPEPAALDELPLVTKEDLLEAQQADPPWGGNLCADPREIAQVHLTSGSSGIGRERYAMSARDVEVMGRSWGPQYEAIGLARGDVAMLTIPVALFCAGLSAFEGARVHGLVPVLTGVASKELMLDLLTEHRVAYLYGVESLLLQLASLARERGFAGRWDTHLKGIQAVGASPHLLEAAREVFGAPVFDVYGCTQAAARISTTCSLGVERGTNHFHPEHLYVETRDPRTGTQVAGGEAEIILSTVYREASPVIRFAIRDKVELVPAGECACGSPLPGFRPGSVSRMDSMLKIRGVNLWPHQVEQLLLAHTAVRDFRAIVQRRPDGSDELLLRVAVHRAGERLVDALEELVRGRTMVRPRVVIEETIAEAVGEYKVKRWEDRRGQLEPAETRDSE
jgi:phenylacetate-CoA ligase